MSDRGSILISTANDIGEALAEKLGGEGYAPSVWDKEYNKLGIAEVDSAPALSVLEDSSETGTARGSILLSTANAIGAMLNKKYNTDRGFKPKEWASACRKMKALETDTKSGSIAHITDGADDVPIKSWEVEIAPTLTGKSAVVCTKSGKNLIDFTQFPIKQPNYLWGYRNVGFPLKKGVTYTFSCSDAVSSLRFVSVDEQTVYAQNSDVATDHLTYTPTDDILVVFRLWSSGISVSWVQLEVGSTATAYEPYTAPTVSTVNLGRTIYGGTADVVKGEGVEKYARIDLGSLTYTLRNNVGMQSNGISSLIQNPPDNYTKTTAVASDYTADTWQAVVNGGTSSGLFGVSGGYICFATTETDVATFKTSMSGKYLVFPLATPTDFTFTPITPTPETALGANNFWADEGDSEIEYYAVPTAYTRGTASGAIANVQSARTDLPFTKVKANIAPNLTGAESVEVTKAGKNLFNKENPNEVDGYITTTGFSTSNTSAKTIYIPIVGGATYTVSKTAGQRFSLATAEVIPSNNAVFTGRQANNTATSISITAGANDKYLWAWIYLDGTDSGTLEDMISGVQIEVGSSATEYTPYEEPAVYTADLGETIYGGYADLVSGTGKTKVYKHTFTGDNLSSVSLNYGTAQDGYTHLYFYTAGIPLAYNPSSNNVISDIGIPWNNNASSSPYPSGECYRVMNNTGSGENQRPTVYAYIHNTWSSVDDFKAWLNLNPITIVYEVETETEFTFDGQVISPSEGVNNLWNNAGGDTDVEYFEQE